MAWFAIATLEVVLGWLVVLLLLWKMLADGFSRYCDFESGLRMIFALLRLGKSLADTLLRFCDSELPADGFFCYCDFGSRPQILWVAIVTLEVARGWLVVLLRL
jgi:hypothetical protein